MDAVAYVGSRGGLVARQDLLDRGLHRRDLTQLVADGRLCRPRNGWYATLDPEHPRYRALRIGGRLTGASALADMGAWMFEPPAILEVAVVRGSARLRADPGAVLHWESSRQPLAAEPVSLEAALARVTLDHDLEVAVPCIDWALHTGRLGRFDFERFLLALPRAARVVREWVDGESESVLESVARVRLQRAGWPLQSQLPVGMLDSIDLVVADRVGLELDGRKHHESRFERDRRKDLQIAIEGRIPLRVSYSMLRQEWPGVELALRALLPGQNSVTPPPGAREEAAGSASRERD